MKVNTDVFNKELIWTDLFKLEIPCIIGGGLGESLTKTDEDGGFDDVSL